MDYILDFQVNRNKAIEEIEKNGINRFDCFSPLNASTQLNILNNELSNRIKITSDDTFLARVFFELNIGVANKIF